MSLVDIVERLRGKPVRHDYFPEADRHEAADEIEQLRMKIRTLRQDDGAVIVQLQNDIREACAEIERLKERIADLEEQLLRREPGASADKSE